MRQGHALLVLGLAGAAFAGAFVYSVNRPDPQPNAKSVPIQAAPSAVVNPLRSESEAAFVQVATVLTHPRCQNCHTLTDFPRQTDSRRRHAMNVRRGPDGHGLPGMTCATCHGSANNTASNVPGVEVEEWHLAPLSMGWEGLTLTQMCRNLKDATKNGGRSGKEVIDHLDTHLVQWGWHPGADLSGRPRSIPPLSHAEFVSVARRWVETGAECPVTDQRTPVAGVEYLKSLAGAPER